MRFEVLKKFVLFLLGSLYFHLIESASELNEWNVALLLTTEHSKPFWDSADFALKYCGKKVQEDRLEVIRSRLLLWNLCGCNRLDNQFVDNIRYVWPQHDKWTSQSTVQQVSYLYNTDTTSLLGVEVINHVKNVTIAYSREQLLNDLKEIRIGNHIGVSVVVSLQEGPEIC